MQDAAHRGAANAITDGIAEPAMQPIAQELVGIFSQTTPNVNWGKEFGQILEQFPDTLMLVAGASLLGARESLKHQYDEGARMYREMQSQHARDPLALRVLGYGADQIQRIGQAEDSYEAMLAEWRYRPAHAPDMLDAAREYGQRARAVRESRLALERSGALGTVTLRPDGVWLLGSQNGGALEFPDQASAEAARWRRVAQQRHKLSATERAHLDLLEEAVGSLAGGTEEAAPATTMEAKNSAAGPGRLQFSSGSGQANPFQNSTDPVVQVHARLAQSEGAFQFGKSKSNTTSMEELAKEFETEESPLNLAVESKDKFGNRLAYLVTTKQGKIHIIIDHEKRQVVVSNVNARVNELKPDAKPEDFQSGAGAQVYQLAQTYAYNNDLHFVSDSVVYPIAQRRRISNMISSILRHDTSDHIDGTQTYTDPFDWEGENKEDVPGWQPGQTEHNLALLLRKEHEYVMAAAKTEGIDLSQLTPDLRTGTVHNEHTGQALTKGDLRLLVASFNPRKSGVGETTLLRALLTESALRGNASGRGFQSVLREVPQSGSGQHDARKADNSVVSLALDTYYSRPQKGAGGRAPRRVADALSGRTEGIAATVAETARALNEQHPGLLGADTHLFSDVDELLASDYAKKHPFTDEELARMRGAEGFFDKSTGKSIVIAGNVELRAGETADSALRRVILHERVGHHGLDVLLNAPGRDGKASIHRRRWEELSGKIPPEELAAIAGEGGYQHLAGNNAALALEWFARKAESDPSLLTKPGFIRELWERFKLMATDLMYAYGNKDLLKDADLETQTCELLMRARQAAVRGRERMESGTPLFNDRQDSSSVVKSVIGDANAKISSDRMAKYSTTIDSMQDADSFTDPRLQFSFSPFKPLGFILQRWNGIVDRWLQRWNGIVDRWLNREDLGREPIHLGMTPPVLVAAGAAPRSIMVPLPCWQK